MKKLSNEGAELLAAKFRMECGLSAIEPISVKSVLRILNILTVYKPLSNTFYGLSVKKGDYCFVLVNSATTRGRQHFTIAHELYHLFYDENPQPHICSVDVESSVSEKNANLFASALLMPKDGILKFLSADQIKSKNISLASIIKLEQLFSVSRQSLLFRLKSIGVLSENKLQDYLQVSVKESALLYGYDLSLYESGNDGLIISDFGIKARDLYDQEKISEGHYNELMRCIAYE